VDVVTMAKCGSSPRCCVRLLLAQQMMQGHITTCCATCHPPACMNNSKPGYDQSCSLKMKWCLSLWLSLCANLLWAARNGTRRTCEAQHASRGFGSGQPQTHIRCLQLCGNGRGTAAGCGHAALLRRNCEEQPRHGALLGNCSHSSMCELTLDNCLANAKMQHDGPVVTRTRDVVSLRPIPTD